MEQVPQNLRSENRYTTPEGEEWRAIAYPNYRPSPCAKAWKYVSSWGRLLSDDLRIGEAKQGKGYFQTTLSIHVDGACGGMTTVALHRIVAFTFLGPPPSPSHTVDHLDRVRENNRAENLKWVPTHEQLANREASSYVLRVDGGPTFTTLTKLAQYACLTTKMLSALLRQALPGDVFELPTVTFCVEGICRKTMASPSPSIHPQTKPLPLRSPCPRRRTVALDLFCEGMSIAEITRQMGIAKSTLLSYLGQAARESNASTLKHLATRLGMDDPGIRQRIHQRLAEIYENTETPRTPEAFADQYRRMVESFLPSHVAAEWEVLKYTFRSIRTTLDHARDRPVDG